MALAAERCRVGEPYANCSTVRVTLSLISSVSAHQVLLAERAQLLSVRNPSVGAVVEVEQAEVWRCTAIQTARTEGARRFRQCHDRFGAAGRDVGRIAKEAHCQGLTKVPRHIPRPPCGLRPRRRRSPLSTAGRLPPEPICGLCPPGRARTPWLRVPVPLDDSQRTLTPAMSASRAAMTSCRPLAGAPKRVGSAGARRHRSVPDHDGLATDGL